MQQEKYPCLVQLTICINKMLGKAVAWARSSLKSGESQGDTARPSPLGYATYSVYLLCQILDSLISHKTCCRREEKDTLRPHTIQITMPQATPVQ